MSEVSKHINKLINSHKISLILQPLIEAVEINKRSGSVDDVDASELLKHVIEVGTELYQSILDNDGEIVDSGLIADKLFITLSKSLRNSLILYNTKSLGVIKDDILSLFANNSSFIQKYQNLHEKEVNSPVDSSSFDRDYYERVDHIVSSLAKLFMPVWLFHTNLYTSGLIDHNKLTSLNVEVSNYLVAVLSKIMDRMASEHGKYHEDFKVNSMFLCSEIISSTLFDYNLKLIKNRAQLDQYIKSPTSLIKQLVPAMMSSFKVLNDTVEGAINELL